MNYALDNLLPLIQTAESASIERLATVCKVMQDTKTNDQSVIRKEVDKWKPGKFTDEKINKSIEFIMSKGWDKILLNK
jgi:hypothetical protein